MKMKNNPSPMLRQKRSLRRGISLLEILFEVILLSVGVLAIIKVMSAGMVSDRLSEGKMTALYLAQEEMEVIKSTATYAAINAHSKVPTSVGGTYADYYREVIVTGDPKQVIVSVYWTENGQKLGVTLSTLLANTYSS